MNDIEAIRVYTQGEGNDTRKEELYRVMMDDNFLSSGLRIAKKNVLHKIRKGRKNNRIV